MGGHIFGIIISLGLIFGGLSGQFVLRGTNSSTALVIAGVGFLIYDIYRLFSYQKTKAEEGEILENLKKNFPLESPCNIILTRDFSPPIVGFPIFLNGIQVGKLKNKSTLSITTNYKKNIIYTPFCPINKFYFEVEEGKGAQLHLIKPKGKEKKCFEIISGAKEISKEDFMNNSVEA